MQDPESLLVDRLNNKDTRAFEHVFNEYYGLLKIYARRFLESEEDADEITQDVFVKFWEKCGSLAADSSIKSYLYRSVHNSCLNFLKHQKVKDNYRQYLIVRLEEASVNNSFSELREQNMGERINYEINNLTPRCAEIFKLSRFEGLKYREIAEHLNISIKTVEVQMGKALKVLRENLKDLNR